MPPAVAAIVAEERAFTNEVQKVDSQRAFRSRVAPDGVAFRPDPATGDFELGNASAFLHARPVRTGVADVVWWPAFAGAASSGDLGFSTGPVIFNGKSYGYVMTVWARQADGSWKFVFDGGPPTDGPSSLTPDTPVEVLYPATARPMSPAEAIEQVAAIERRMAATADPVSAYRPYVMARTHVMGSGGQPGIGWATILTELRRRPRGLQFEQVGARSAASGDLAFTWGWARGPSTARGGYARVWQRRQVGWRLVVEVVQTTPRRAAEPVASQSPT